MADSDAGVSVQLAGPSESDGWAVVIREDALPPTIMRVYITRDRAEAEAEAEAARLRKEIAENL